MVEKMSLEKYGYTVFTVHSGEEAVDVVSSNSKIDLILMDIDLGEGIDGTEAAAQILKNKETPIIFLSFHTEQEIVEKTEKITSYSYVAKNTEVLFITSLQYKYFQLSNTITPMSTTNMIRI